MQLRELGIPTLWISLHIFSEKKVGITLLHRAHLSVEAESNFEVFQFWTCHLYRKLGLFTEEEFFSEPRPGLISSPKLKLGINIKVFGWTELRKSKTLICYWTNTAGFQLQIQIWHLVLVRSKSSVFPFEVLSLRCLTIPSLMKSFRELITSEPGSIGSPWSSKRMN